MDQQNCALAAQFVSSTYIQQGSEALATRHKLIRTLLSHRRLPQEGWDEETIQLFIKDCALMDSNNFPNNVGVGEREARVASRLVLQRHFGLAHGIGRSGDVAAEQPKAAGSSLLAKLANLLVQDALKLAGMLDVGAATVLPLATGMALTLTLLALKAKRPAEARYVLWPRIDQKTCLKAITSAGLVAVPLPLARGEDEDQIGTDVAALATTIASLGADAVVAVVSTTSCFAPRGADALVETAKLCAREGVGHVVNNAYGVQSAQLCALVTAAWRKGRVDAVVQSTDKNFMVPVGGAVVAAGARNACLVAAVNQAYPGRASMAPLLDVLMTLLQWGASGWQAVLAQRERVYRYAHSRLEAFAQSIGERLLHTPGNPISLAMTLSTLGPQQQPGITADSRGSGEACATDQCATDEAAAAASTAEEASCSTEAAQSRAQNSQRQSRPVTFLGSMLFKRGVSGTRVVARGKQQSVAGHAFSGYGAHCDAYPCDYLTFAAALGTTEWDVDEFIVRLRGCIEDFKRL